MQLEYHLADMLQITIVDEGGKVSGKRSFVINGAPFKYTMEVERSYADKRGTGVLCSVRGDLKVMAVCTKENSNTVQRLFILNMGLPGKAPDFGPNVDFNAVLESIRKFVVGIYKKDVSAQHWKKVGDSC